MNVPRLKLIAVVVAVLAALPAHAQRGRGDASRHPPMRNEPAFAPPFAEQMRRDMRRGEGAEVAPMTAEERRQLRRDIHEAGRELYRPHGRRGMPPTRD
jgi:hypothetical protein